MTSLESHEVRSVRTAGAAGETHERMRRVIQDAHARSLTVMLKPHLWIRGGAWRAELAPAAGWEAFFETYEPFLLDYARMAQETGVEVLVVGTELRSSLTQTDSWRRLISRVRAVYEGELVYAANWDASDDVPFWDALDYVGVQFYPSLADDEHTDEASMQARLSAALDPLDALSERVQRPVLITEVGYKSVAGCAVRPYEWTEHRPDAQVDPIAQATAYRVFFAGVAARPNIRGVYLWKWFTDPDTGEEGPGGFSPRGKPAAAVLQEVFRHPVGEAATL
jgi:hypothetical protein